MITDTIALLLLGFATLAILALLVRTLWGISKGELRPPRLPSSEHTIRRVLAGADRAFDQLGDEAQREDAAHPDEQHPTDSSQ